MALQPHPRSPVQQSRARGSPLTLAGHQPLGPDDDPSTNEGRGTPHETPEGLDQTTSCRSDHSNPFHTTLGQSYRVSEPKGGIGVLDKPSSPGSVWEGATPAGMPSAELPASSPPTEASSDPEGFGLTVAAIKPAAVNSPQGHGIHDGRGAEKNQVARSGCFCFFSFFHSNTVLKAAFLSSPARRRVHRSVRNRKR